MSKDTARRAYSLGVKFEDYPTAAPPAPALRPPVRAVRAARQRGLPAVSADESCSAIAVVPQSAPGVVEAGGTVIEEHRAAPQLFTLYSGWAFRYKTLSDGRRQILGFLLPGDFIGLQDEFADGQTHGVEAVTGRRRCAASSATGCGTCSMRSPSWATTSPGWRRAKRRWSTTTS